MLTYTAVIHHSDTPHRYSGNGSDLLHMKDHSGRTPLHYAIYNGCSGQIKILEKLLPVLLELTLLTLLMQMQFMDQILLNRLKEK